ncbi:MAG: DUF5309 domain-containing protein [Pyrinomonadaceae bacterium]|nr:DUF5309 domain-containing protein [Pyrinomonadaceae bacterium]
MAQLAGTTDTYDLIGLAEDVEDVIWNISPEETPLLTMAKRVKVTQTLHQWQTDALAAAGTNAAVEGDDSTYATATPTTMLANYTQIFKKTVMVSGTADAVRKYGRKEEFAYQMMKRGKELKRDIEFSMAQNSFSSVGTTAAARRSAGLESMIAGNRVFPATTNTVGTTAGYAAGLWTAPVDGTTAAFNETALIAGIEAAWTDGGDPSVLMMNSTAKRAMNTFAGASSYAGVTVNQSRSAQGAIIAGVDFFVSPFGDHKVVLNRHMRARTVFGIDPEYISFGFLRPIKFEPRAKTGDAERGEMLAEGCLIVGNPDAHFKVQDVS